MLHYTFDEYEGTLEKMIAHLQQEIAHSNEDPQYYDTLTRAEVENLLKHLVEAYDASRTINKIIEEGR